MAQNLDLLLRSPCRVELFANQGGVRADALKTHVFALSADAAQTHFSLTLRAVPTGPGAGDALFERTETVVQRDELERLLAGASTHSVQLRRSVEVPFFYEAGQLQILVGLARLQIVAGNAQKLSQMRFRPPFIKLNT